VEGVLGKKGGGGPKWYVSFIVWSKHTFQIDIVIISSCSIFIHMFMTFNLKCHLIWESSSSRRWCLVDFVSSYGGVCEILWGICITFRIRQV